MVNHEISKITTLCYLVKDDAVLLTLKKKGFGVGKWNGAGGKVEIGETPLESVTREMREEVGVEIQNPDELGYLEFIWPEEKKEWNQRCYIFSAGDYRGEICESEECRPQWFAFDRIPYEQMWDDDRHWYPEMLAGRPVYKRFYFDASGRLLNAEDIII